ncbi:MAG: hypothetical protein R3260_00385 [Pseudomonas sp.]|nr:hypothetical protein [Pseudomonas sp.]
MSEIFQADWFQMPEIRRRRLSSGIWIPLRQSEQLATGGTKGKPGYFEESLCVGSLAVRQDRREIGDTLSWNDIGLIHVPGPYAFEDGRYKPADQYWHYDKEDPVGIELVLLNRLNGAHETEWHVNQDLVIALGLLREGDSWFRVDEGYIEVIRQRRDPSGSIVAIEIRAEHLRDYLCARKLALRLVQYRQRLQIMADTSHLPWYGKNSTEKTATERFGLRTFAITEDGSIPGRVAVMKAWRTDVDHGEDVPEFGPEDDSNTDFESYQFDRGGPTVERVEGELWRDEWVEPAAASERVRRDTPAEQLYYSVGAAGEKAPASKLNNEDVGKYLWFKAEVIEALLAYRGASLSWYTAETGSISCSPDYYVHFGINENCRINVYAYDVARLPLWQQQIWHGFNISPDGPPSRELLDSQQRCEPAHTKAPEVDFQVLIEKLNALFDESFGGPLFKPHDHAEQILGQCHRFRALKENGILALAKDIARLTADSIDISLLRTLLPLDPKEKFGGLKLLERVLQSYCDKEAAYRIMGPLHIAYGLRLGDAHLPSKTEIQKSLSALGVTPETEPLLVGAILLDSVCRCLSGIGRTIYEGQRSSSSG